MSDSGGMGLAGCSQASEGDVAIHMRDALRQKGADAPSSTYRVYMTLENMQKCNNVDRSSFACPRFARAANFSFVKESGSTKQQRRP